MSEQITQFRALLGYRINAFDVRWVYTFVGVGFLLKAASVHMMLNGVFHEDKLKLPVLGFIPEFSPEQTPFIIWPWVISAILFSFRKWVRGAGGVLITLSVLVMLLDKQLYSNHLYLGVLLLILLLIAKSTRDESSTSLSYWPLFLLKAQVSIVYIFAALQKLNADFLSGEVLREYWIQGSVFTPPAAMVEAGLFQYIAIAAVLTELFLGIAFWIPRLRALVVTVGVSMHSSFMLTFDQASKVEFIVFSFLMLSGYFLLFVKPGNDSASGRSRGGLAT